MARPGRIVRDEHTDRLFQALKTMETPDEFYAFFKDLCTANEMIAMKQRFWVAELLEAGYVYSDIVELTGASTATISRVNRCLQTGENGGYELALERRKQWDKQK